MNNEAVADVAETVLRPVLGPIGFDHLQVRDGYDHEEDAALFVTAFYKKGSAVPIGTTLIDAMVVLRRALQQKGEDRFPYLHHQFGNDEGFEDLDESEGNGGD